MSDRRLLHSAMYDDAHTFLSILDTVDVRDNMYQRLAEVAATTANMDVIDAIMGIYSIDASSVAVIARMNGHYDLAEYLTGYRMIPFQYDMPTYEDMEEDRGQQAQYWENSGYWVMIKTDSPIQEYDASRKRKIEGTRRWGWEGDNLDAPETTHMEIIRP